MAESLPAGAEVGPIGDRVAAIEPRTVGWLTVPVDIFCKLSTNNGLYAIGLYTLGPHTQTHRHTQSVLDSVTDRREGCSTLPVITTNTTTITTTTTSSSTSPPRSLHNLGQKRNACTQAPRRQILFSAEAAEPHLVAATLRPT
ncbi:hypothetical protein P280DRAFT_171680 [Massarina eburnea CBS 473.64]|uniref:Uncharacterized protein n=1 Tax=Massarina eburnea CBS 473.64 TaxID=1395130 RepID=A0A6A6SB57_9PLEO|nr:hypothetical protein P280DRAFT_171680 [Massarina eburnea CBS 473.64]